MNRPNSCRWSFRRLQLFNFPALEKDAGPSLVSWLFYACAPNVQNAVLLNIFVHKK
jgi:hypothetical protein